MGGAAFTFFIILACTKYVWLVRSTSNLGERFMVMVCLGAAMIAGALFQPRGAGYAALGAILFSLLLLHWNRQFARPEKLRENKAGGGAAALAKKIEQLVINLQPNPALRTLRVALQYLWLLLTTTLLGTGFYGYQLSKKLQKIEIWSAEEYRQSALAHRLNPHLISLRSTTITQRLLATRPQRVVQPVAADAPVLVEARAADVSFAIPTGWFSKRRFAAVTQANSRLACQIQITDALDGLVVSMPEGQH